MISVNTNNTATVATMNLNKSNDMLRSSLNRLSSGKRIVNPADDAGGLAVSYKLEAALNRGRAVENNISNGISFLQTQDGALKTVGNILDRMSELRTMAEDITKNSNDRANYNTEFTELKGQLSNILSEQFNGISLFASSGGKASKMVYTTEQGSASSTVAVSVNQASLGANLTVGGTALTSSAASASLQSFSVANFTTAIQNLATLRAANGAQTSRLQFAQEQLKTNNTNIEAANSRIIDVDVASETTRFARYNILVQSGASMVSQANALSNVALQLLG